jgi:predicted ATPase/class 3 adenylate cyclase
VCGAKSPAGQKFCGNCGEPLQADAAQPSPATPDSFTPRHLAQRILTSRSALEGERKHVTVLFADIKGSLELIESYDAEVAHRFLSLALAVMMRAVHRYEGTVNKVLGDGIMALFGAPIANEDHAVRACYAALAMQQELRKLSEQTRIEFGAEPQLRVGINSGEVVFRAIGNDLSLDYDAIGPTTHLAGRMEQLALPGTVRITLDTYRLAEGFIEIESLGRLPVKGLDEAIEIFELKGVTSNRSRFQLALERGLNRFIGRKEELAELGRALDAAAQNTGQVFAFVGDAGIGKSRLYHEFINSPDMAGNMLLQSRSSSYGKATAYLPVIDLFKDYLQLRPTDDQRMVREKITGKLLTLDESLGPAIQAVQALLDVRQEGDAWGSLDPGERRRRIRDSCVDILLAESRQQPLVVVFEDLHWIDSETRGFLDRLVLRLASARILLLVNYRPEYDDPWIGVEYCQRRRIDPLSEKDIDELLDVLLGYDTSLERVRALLSKCGNPFELEETVRTLVETDYLEGQRGSYRLVKPLRTLKIPATVQNILSARVDRLQAHLKQLLQTASVIGKDVPRELLLAVAELGEDEVDLGLSELQEGEFLYQSRLYPDLEYSFKHALTHEVVYHSLLLEQRQRLHRKIIDCIEERHADRLGEHLERLAQHAYRGGVWEKAADYLSQVGRKVAARSAYLEAAYDFQRALEALGHLAETEQSIGAAIDLRFELRSSLQAIGEHDRVYKLLLDAEAAAKSLGDRCRLGWASAYLSQYLWFRGEAAKAEQMCQRAISLAEDSDDADLGVVARYFLGQGHFSSGDFPVARRYLLHNIDHLRGDKAYQRHGLTGLPAVLARIWYAWSLAEQGAFAQSRTHIQEAREIAAQARQPYSQAAAALGGGQIELLCGQLDDAMPLLAEAHDQCHASDLTLILPSVHLALGLHQALSGQVEEAVALLEEGERKDLEMRIFQTPLLATAPGVGYLLDGKLDRAESFARCIIDRAREGGKQAEYARGMLLLAEVELCKGAEEGERLKIAINEVIGVAESLGMRPLVAEATLLLAYLLRKCGEAEPAEVCQGRAMALCRESGLTLNLQRIGLHAN